MKKIISLLLVLVVLCSSAPAAFGASFETKEAANDLHLLGLFSGTGTDANGNPNFALDRAPTRHEAITMLIALLGKSEEAASGTWETPFTDVANWAKPFVGYAYANGLSSGTSVTTYGGNKMVTASQYLTFVLTALGYESGVDFQWNKAWELSDQIGLTSGQYNANSKQFLRGDIATISFQALQTKQKLSDQTLADKLIAEGVFTQAEYEKAKEGPVILKNETDGSKFNIPYSYQINGELYSVINTFRAKAGKYVVTPLYNGTPITDYSVETDGGSGSVKKNSDGTFTVDFPAKNDLSIAVWFTYEHQRTDENGQPETFYTRSKTSMTIASPVPKSGFVLDYNGQNWLPEITFGDNFRPYFVLDVYYNGKLIQDYDVTVKQGAPFTATVQADGTLLLMKTGKGRSEFTITYQGKSETFKFFPN